MITASVPPSEAYDFATRIIRWQKLHGRHDLPWQNTRDPYAIWVSEIMLQQTQVTAVIGYYRRFMQRFPDIASLASADQDEVLQYWSGLGYYSRARNLHSAARQIMQVHDGKFPQALEAVLALPGIGRSTAAAITAFAFGQRQAILDGNVKRVLARCFGVEGWPGVPTIEKGLWQMAEALLPQQHIESYTQGLMDLGATLCTRGKPSCGLCPLQEHCIAKLQGKTHLLPAAKPRKTVPQRETVMLVVLLGNEVLLEKRPSRGIWGGLWSLPEISVHEDARQAARQKFGLEVHALETLPPLIHAFTHFTLTITPRLLQVVRQHSPAMGPGFVWLGIEEAVDAALPAPVRKLLQQQPLAVGRAA